MTKKRADLKILLMQIRDDKETALEEFYEFVEFSKLLETQFTSLNIFTTPVFEPNIIEGFDALFVGGSSDATVLKPEKYPFVPSSKELVRYCYEKDIPVFASCFGFQLAVEAFGGKIILDQDNMEMGTYQIYLNDTAKDDPLLHDTPTPFWAISGHKERASLLPPEAIPLAHSDVCPYHLFKMPGKPFYAFQFHPEVGRKDLIARITRYQTRYLNSADELQQIIERSTHESPHSNELVEKFIDRIILAD